MSLHLSTFFPGVDLVACKAHLAVWNGYNNPLDVFVRSREEWDRWNSWRSERDDFSRNYIFSLIDFYPEKETWLFGGLYRVLARGSEVRAHSYVVERLKEFADLEGRLKIRFKRPGRVRSVKLERWISEMKVSELLKEEYNGEAFPGYDNLCLDFPMLETIISRQRPDWRAALEHVKGVYLIADVHNGRKYVGSACGEAGIWARWASYAQGGHGGNAGLAELVAREGIEYARRHFRISLLEFRPATADDKLVLEREQYWKKVLVSGESVGYNRN